MEFAIRANEKDGKRGGNFTASIVSMLAVFEQSYYAKNAFYLVF